MAVRKTDDLRLAAIAALRGVISDTLAGISTIGGAVPGGVSLADDMLRVVARSTADRLHAEHGLDVNATSLADAFERYIALQTRLGLADPTAVTVARISDSRLRVTLPEDSCPYHVQCRNADLESDQRLCPMRFYPEQFICASTGRQASSSVVAAGTGVCAFELFLTDDSAKPLERLRRRFAETRQESALAKDALGRLQDEYRLILETIDDAIMVLDRDGTVSYVNPRACGAFAVDQASAVRAPFKKGGVFGRLGDLCIVAAESLGKWEGATTIENSDGGRLRNIYLARFSGVTAYDGVRLGTLIVLEDVTREEMLRRELAARKDSLEKDVIAKTHELQEANAKLDVLAHTDALTGLPNRRTFEEVLRAELRRAIRYDHSTGLLMVDIDEFKHVNDVHGHQAGDAVLKRVAVILSKSVRSSDFVARWGGDEFSILLPRAGIADCEAVARRISENLLIENACPNGSQAPLSLSVGWATERKGNAESLLAAADRMMYDHKMAVKARNRRDGSENRAPKAN